MFKVTEANTSKENLLPYNSVVGSGCFVKNDGTILTSALIVNPWLDASERLAVIQAVFASKTIRNFSLDQDYMICGETANLQWLADGLVNNAQNYIAASAAISCHLTDSSAAVIQSVKKKLPKNAQIVDFFSDSIPRDHSIKNSTFYYSTSNLPRPNSILKDTFYLARDSFNISIPINYQLPALPEGSTILNERGELTGIIQQHKIILIQRYHEQLKTQSYENF